MVILIAILQILLFFIADVVSHTVSWNLQKRYPVSLGKFMLATAILLVFGFHAFASPWVWVLVTGICIGWIQGILEARQRDYTIHL